MPDMVVNSISLVPNGNLKQEFELRINMALITQNKNNIQTIVNKHGMHLKEFEDSVLIYGSKRKTDEMPIIIA
jgi:hypothetical protein